MRSSHRRGEGVPAGGKLVFYLAPYADAQVQLNDANWGQQGDIIDVPADASKVEFELSADFLNAVLTTEDGWSETAIIVNGHSAVRCRCHVVGIAYLAVARQQAHHSALAAARRQAEVTATAVKVVFPEMAQSGNAVLNLKSGKTVAPYSHPKSLFPVRRVCPRPGWLQVRSEPPCRYWQRPLSLPMPAQPLWRRR